MSVSLPGSPWAPPPDGPSFTFDTAAVERTSALPHVRRAWSPTRHRGEGWRLVAGPRDDRPRRGPLPEA